FAYDIFKRWRPATSDHQLVVTGKITPVVATLLAILWSPLLSHYATIYDGLARLISYISPPITAVFLAGVFSKKASGKAAYITLLAGSALGALMFLLDFFGKPAGTWLAGNGLNAAKIAIDTVCFYTVRDFMLTAFWLLLVCGGILASASRLYPEPLKPEAMPLVWTDWREPLRGRGAYRLIAGAVATTFVVLYVWLH
ncbi:MAG: hypothetical protein NTY38_10265, partial [Acidobacteria bacterium]|nr:hypothetical protein [Acidobacteriota bacterium]